MISFSVFFNDTATTEIYTDLHTLSRHDALPISDDHAKALEAAERSGKPMVITKVQLAVIERRLDSGDTAGAMSLLQRATAEIVALNTNGQFATAAVARQRLRLIYLLARAGNVREAEQLEIGRAHV